MFLKLRQVSQIQRINYSGFLWIIGRFLLIYHALNLPNRVKQ